MRRRGEGGIFKLHDLFNLRSCGTVCLLLFFPLPVALPRKKKITNAWSITFSCMMFLQFPHKVFIVRPVLQRYFLYPAFERQWNPALRPPRLLDRLVITTTIFRPNWYFINLNIPLIRPSRYHDQDLWPPTAVALTEENTPSSIILRGFIKIATERP